MKLYRHQSILSSLKRVIPDIENSLTLEQKIALCCIYAETCIDGWSIHEISDYGDVTLRKGEEFQAVTYQQLADSYWKGLGK